MANTSSTTSSMTSTSHTMTAFPVANISSRTTMNSSNSANLMGVEALALENRHIYIAPPPSLPSSSLASVKGILDSFAVKLGEEQTERLKDERRKRKRNERDAGDAQLLKIRKIHVDGFDVDQVWQQATRVIDALMESVSKELNELSGFREDADDGIELLETGELGVEVGSEDDSDIEDQEESDLEEESQEEDEMDFEVGEAEEETNEELRDDDNEIEDESQDDEDDQDAGVYVEDPNGLNDGFFSIDDFNKQTEFLEQQDAAADPFTGEASDEEDIDWDNDPLAAAPKLVSSSSRAKAMDIDDSEDDSGPEAENDENDGPTFGNMDLNAPEGDSEDDESLDGMDEDVDRVGDNTNDILYKDFFEPPPAKASRGERQAKYLERQARKDKNKVPEDEAAGIERAMADVRRDLFDDSEQEDSEDALSEVDPADPRSRKSAHERRQTKIAEEIRRLEAASVAKREWTLAGEARAADRPLNSLLEEDLDFERTGKPVLEVTAEVTESMEELIKRRILAQEFDEVIRRRPDDLSASSGTRRGLFELDDSKPQQSLAELYEEEHVKANNPDTYVSKADEKLQKEEQEIEALWKEVSTKLDALSSWHYKPKPAAPNLTVVSDVATIAMEDAQPTTASGINGGESMLAPQEIYKAGKDRKDADKGEIVPKTGAPIARQEMTREEKLRRRRREKERIKKRGGVELNQRAESAKTKQKRETLSELKKGGVKIIGKKGDVKDVEGNKAQGPVTVNGAGSFKL